VFKEHPRLKDARLEDLQKHLWGHLDEPLEALSFNEGVYTVLQICIVLYCTVLYWQCLCRTYIPCELIFQECCMYPGSSLCGHAQHQRSLVHNKLFWYSLDFIKSSQIDTSVPQQPYPNVQFCEHSAWFQSGTTPLELTEAGTVTCKPYGDLSHSDNTLRQSL